MRNDSCRKCGSELEVNQNCPVCKKPIEFFCHVCSVITEKQIHSDCMIKKSLIAV